MAELSLEHLNKLPKWAWVVGLVGAAGLAYWYTHQGGGSATAPAAPADGSSNTTTPTGSALCPQYQVPPCDPPGIVIFEPDQNGCPQPVCTTGGGGGGGGGGGAPVCHSVPHGGTCTVGRNCPGSTLRQIFTAEHQDVNCAVQWNPSAGRHLAHPLDDPLWTTPVPFVVFF